MNTQQAIEKEQQRETARSLHRQAVELQRKQNISYAAAKSQTEQRDTAQPFNVHALMSGSPQIPERWLRIRQPIKQENNTMKEINEYLESTPPRWDPNQGRWIEPEEDFDETPPTVANNATNETRAANFVVWWFETNDFNGKTSRCYRDFETIRGARVFARTKDGSQYDTINSQPWHHYHARIPSKFICGSKPKPGLQHP